MELLQLLKIIQIILAVTLTFFVLIQSKGKGLSSAFGGMGGGYRTKRGLEKMIFRLSVLFGILFVVNSLLIVFYS